MTGSCCSRLSSCTESPHTRLKIKVGSLMPKFYIIRQKLSCLSDIVRNQEGGGGGTAIATVPNRPVSISMLMKFSRF